MSCVPPTLDAHVRLLTAHSVHLTECAIDKRRSADSVGGTGRASLPHGVRKACRRLRETGGADPWCGPGLTTSVVLLSILEYYAYSISPGQAAAHGGHAMLSGGHVVLLNVHVPYDSHNEPHDLELLCGYYVIEREQNGGPPQVLPDSRPSHTASAWIASLF